MSTKIERKLIPLIRWVARIIGTALVGLILLFIVAHIFDGEDQLKPADLTTLETLMFLAMFIEMAGLVIAWKWEGIGAGLTLVGYIAFSILEGDFWIPPVLPVFLIVALLYAYCWLRGGSAET